MDVELETSIFVIVPVSLKPSRTNNTLLSTFYLVYLNDKKSLSLLELFPYIKWETYVSNLKPSVVGNSDKLLRAIGNIWYNQDEIYS